MPEQNGTAKRRRTLLLVDDEENILRSLKRVFRRENYHIFTASNGRAGLEVLGETPVDVILSDHRMPEMSGIEFLSKAKERYPDTIRIMLSGFTELKMVTDAINHGAIYKFLTKPWDDDLLRKNIEEAFHHGELYRENIRLAAELKKANEELQVANKRLENDVAFKSTVAEAHLRTLQIEQEVLEHIPVGVVGFGDDGLIAVANMKAYELVQPVNGYLIGSTVREIFGDKLWQRIHDAAHQEFTTEMPIGQGHTRCHIYIKCMGKASLASGKVMVITAPEAG